MKTCSLCGLTKSTDEFYQRRESKVNRKDPFSSRCKSCASKTASERVSNHRRNLKLLLVEDAGSKCLDCGYEGQPFVFDFDHRDPTQKSFNISASTVLGLRRLREEAKKCDLVCANCHRFRTHKQRCSGCEYCETPL